MFADALNLLLALPHEGRDNARDAILLFAADAIRNPQQADDLLARAPTETRSEFVMGYVQLAAARIRSKQPRETKHDLLTLLNGIERAAEQSKNTKRLALRLGAAELWSDVDSGRAAAALDLSLRDLDEDKKT